MFAGCVTSSRCILRAGKPRTAVVCAGKHQGAFVENGWCIISIPLAKLLIEGGVELQSCSSLPGSNGSTCSRPAKSSMCCSGHCFCHVRLCGLCAVTDASASSAHSDSGFPPSTAAVTLYCSGEFGRSGNSLRGGVCTPVSWVRAFNNMGRGHQIST